MLVLVLVLKDQNAVLVLVLEQKSLVIRSCPCVQFYLKVNLLHGAS